MTAKKQPASTRAKRDFHALTADLDIATDKLAKLKGIPSLVTPEAAAQTSALLDRPTHDRADDVQDEGGGYLKIWCPGYVYSQLYARCGSRSTRSTLQFVVMEALKKAGYHVLSEDLVPDRRRAKGPR